MQNETHINESVLPTSDEAATKVVVTGDGKGNYKLPASMYQIDVAPTPFFGQNIADFGWDMAVAIQENADDPKPHNFGACVIRVNSLRPLPTGEWAIDLRVPKFCRRMPDACFEEEVLDEDGNVTGTREEIRPKMESWVTVLLSQVTALVDHPLSQPYFQRDSDTAAAIAVNEASAKIAAGRTKKTGEKKKRGKSTRISPAAIRARMEKAKSS